MKNVRPRESLATPKPRKPRFLLRWSPTGKMFDSVGKLVAPNGDNACTSNTMEPKIKRFPNSTSLLGRNDHVAAILGFAGSESCPPMLNKENYVPWSSRLLTDDELTEKELKQIEADDQAIQIILLGLPDDIYEKKAKLFNEWEMFTSNEGESIESYYHRFLKLMNDLKRNKHFLEKIVSNLKFLNNLKPEWSCHLTIVHQTKDLHTADYTQLESEWVQRSTECQESESEWDGNLAATRAEGNASGHNGNQIRCYNYKGVGHFARSFTVRPRRRDAAYLQTQLLIAQKEEAGIQLQAEEFDLMAAAADLDKIEEVNANCILMANLQQASTSGTQTDKPPVYDSDGSSGVHDYENCDDNEIFNMFTQKEQYTELLEPIPKQHQHDPSVVHDSEETLQLAQESRENMKQLNKEIKPANYTKINHLSGVFVSQTAKSREELYFSNDSKTTNVSKSISLPNEEFSDDTTPSVACKFLNEVKSTIMTLQRVVKHRITLETHNWSSSAHQKLYKIVKDENFPIVNQVDTRVQNFEIQFLMEEAKFFGDFKSLAKEDDESLAKHKALELEIERLLRAVVSQDIISVVQKESVVDTSNLQTELERTKERFENYIIKKENAYAKLWNDWYKKCDECKFDKISYAKAYKDMQQKIEWLQAQLGDLKGKITSNSASTPQESKVMKNDKVIAPGMFRINPFKIFRESKHMPNKVRASARTKPITISQPSVITKKDVNSDSNGLSFTGIDNTKTRRPQPWSNTKNDRVPSVSKSSRSKNKEAEVEEHHRNLLLFKNNKHMSFSCNNIKHDSQNIISKAVCAMCKQCLISVNHNVCLRNYVKGKTSRGNLNLLINFVWKFMGTVRFENDHVAVILGFDDLQWGNILITRVYFVEGLGYNLFSVGQFCDSDLEVAFRRNACFIRNLEGVDLLKGDRSTNLYTINLHEMASVSPIYLMARLLKFKYHKEHLCPSCEQGKSKRASHPPKPVPNSRQRLHLLHMDLCGPMRIASINEKRYLLNDREDIRKLGAKGDIGFFIGYSADSCAYRVSGLDLTYAPLTITIQQPTEGELDLLFEAMYDDYIGGQPSATARSVSAAQAKQVRQTSTTSTSISDTAPTPTNLSSHAKNIPITLQDVDELNPNAIINGNTFVNPFANPSTSAAESSSS
uniref:Retrovirus-related Pol polyprotein from transposon TNT 1-94 n=1 Tax=Tanacetum cinerariifolium TaxID=118510 RepID=A0A6L2NVW7_TANCI|nr:retrovirus-related Pol polyprotein from transposon TNT 1-94 [Tanacetum cinerariifolium]